jgi:hypothetical protein
MKATDLTVGQKVIVHHNSRTFPARVKGFGPRPYEVIVTRDETIELSVHEYNVDKDDTNAA